MTSSVFDKHFGRIIHSWQSGIVISTRGYESSQLFEGIGPRLLISQTFNLTERLSSQPKIRENLNQMFLQCIKHWCGIYCLHVFQDSWRFNRMGQNVVINLSMPSDIEEHKSLQTMDLVFNYLIVKSQVLCSVLILLLVSWKQWPIRNHSSAKGCIS
ncbi:uncharacterized protein LOC123227520 isoform X14 [Mangifera indica]|uniref:uncharacterized protein LOC123227520 isoform X14 n=1 Tax=Mangifera indica TaxID=29780 RepID=UPI001CFB291B|nr:uncharacterized protein LOC123227520 isoform X14 [Mangifera indica]XP_044508427.1 uncharacterized protein LOC123227520 isoform X14 [Mangifera indica]XP_044508428.1 uncharacterized protein LOC123227520 isoform X14 [Mangifera indica]